MPRKTAKREASHKEVSHKEVKEKESEDVKVIEQEGTPRRSGRASKSDSGEPERSRRSSTAAQTAASVAESRVTRSRNSRRDSSSPSEGRRSSGREIGVESPATRVKSSRRSTGRINYKESDGEEEPPTPKTEENFDSNEDYEDSDSDENSKKKSKKSPKTPPKARNVKQKTQPTRVGGRGRPKKKSETIVVSDESADELSDSSEKKAKDVEEESKPSKKRPRKSSTTDSGDKPSRRSSRGSISGKTPEPSNRRPSRNKQIKKYTEVDEDFSDVKSEDEEEAGYEQEVKRETSRKRKREKVDEVASTKKPKREKSADVKSADVKSEEEEETSEPEEKEKEKKSTKSSDTVKESKSEEAGEEESDDEEAMEIDEEDSNSAVDQKSEEKDAEEKLDEEKGKTEDEEKSVKASSEEKTGKDVDAKKPESSQDIEVNQKESEKEHVKEKSERASPPKDDLDDTQHSKTSSQYSDGGEDSMEDSEDASSKMDVISKPEQSNSAETDAVDLKTSINCFDSKQENTFPSKESASETSINGENDKLDAAPVQPPVASTTPQSHEDLPPKQNGAHDQDNAPQRIVNCIPLRRYVANPSLSEDVRLSLKEKTFGVASYNLRGLESVNKDKLVQELGKLQASIICLQDVSRALYYDLLESNMDVLGFKGVGSWPKGVQHNGLATFYKTSVFRLTSTSETSLQKIIEQELEASNMDDSSREAIFRNLNRCGSMFFTRLSTVLGDRHLIVANVEIPSGSIASHTMQVSCMSREVVNVSDNATKPVLLCGELNLVENKVPYWLLRHGCLTRDMVEELKSKNESSLPEVAALETILMKASQRPSRKMSSCYATVLGKELQMPAAKVTSSNLLWTTPENLHTVGVLDFSSDFSDNTCDHPVSLKADVAFSV